MTWWQDDIRDTADALTEPSIHREPVPYWDKNKHRKIRHYQTVQPGLLAQLYQAVLPAACSAASDVPSGGKPGSRPPLAVEALSTHAEITTKVAGWCSAYGLQRRANVESNLRQLAAKAMSFDEPTAHTLLAELRRWRRWCLVMTGWEIVRTVRGVPCPEVNCGRLDTLRVNLTTTSALCRGCGAVWSDEDGSIGVLARHVTEKSHSTAA